MSFSQDVKAEVCSKKIPSACCMKAFCYGAACFSKYFDARGIVLQTETQAVAAYVKKMFHLCDIQGNIETKERPSGSIYEFTVKDPDEVQKMLEFFGHSGNETTLRINPENLACPRCYNAFVAAAFLCGGTMTDPKKEYGLEFFTPKYNLAKDFEGILAENEFQPHRTNRKGANVIYIKASEKIEEILAFMGAGKASMHIMNSRMYKEMRNKTNRLINCEAANMSKRVQATVQVKKAVEYLQSRGYWEDLPTQVKVAATMRLTYPEYSLAELAEQFDPPVSKSGLSHQLKKVTETAKILQEKEENA